MEGRRVTARMDPPEREAGPHDDAGLKGTPDWFEDGSEREDAPSWLTIGAGSIVILIPVFNDWASLARLLPRLDAALADQGLEADVLVVDDGSTMEPERHQLNNPSPALDGSTCSA